MLLGDQRRDHHPQLLNSVLDVVEHRGHIAPCRATLARRDGDVGKRAGERVGVFLTEAAVGLKFHFQLTSFTGRGTASGALRRYGRISISVGCVTIVRLRIECLVSAPRSYCAGDGPQAFWLRRWVGLERDRAAA